MKRFLLFLGLIVMLVVPAGIAFADGHHHRLIAADDTGYRDLSVATGESLTIDGTLEGELSVFGGEVIINGVVENDINQFGGYMQLNGVVEGNLVLFGGQLDLASEAQLNGDCVVLGGSFTPNENPIECTSVPIEIPAVASFVGGSEGIEEINDSGFLGGFSRFLGKTGRAIGLSLVLGTLAMAVAAMFPRHLGQVQEAIKEKPIASGTVGLLTSVAGPSMLALVVLLLTVICVGIPLVPFVAIFAGIALIAASVIGWVAIGDIFGHWFVRRFNLKEMSLPMTAALGTGILTLGVSFLNVLSFEFLSSVLIILLASIGLGAAALTKLGTRRYPAVTLTNGKVQTAIDQMPDEPLGG